MKKNIKNCAQQRVYFNWTLMCLRSSPLLLALLAADNDIVPISQTKQTRETLCTIQKDTKHTINGKSKHPRQVKFD